LSPNRPTLTSQRKVMVVTSPEKGKVKVITASCKTKGNVVTSPESSKTNMSHKHKISPSKNNKLLRKNESKKMSPGKSCTKMGEIWELM
jgi:hypothetical protein